MQPKLVIDLRCLQDRNYAERGIGGHARNIVAHSPEAFIGLFDPALPELPGEIAKLAAVLSPHGYLPDLPPGAVFLNPSPMTPGQNFVARLLLDERVLKAACVHDFIPYDQPEVYLTHPINRLDYFAAMAWLRRYDILLTNSVPTQARLRELYDGPSVVTGVALPPWAEGLVAGAPRHILMVGGDDARKNPELLARAHGASPVLRNVPLVISGTYTPETAARLRGLTRLELPGRLSDAEMHALYARAICVVVPSRAEGFSLPVIEAGAAGVPVIASDIPAHRALLADAAQLFAPDDAAGLGRMLEEIVSRPERRAEVIAAQAAVARDFTPAAVAGRIFGAVARPAPAVLRRGRPRIAMLTPMPPDQSGIADYSAALLPELRERAEVTVFTGDSVSALAHLDRRFDRVVGVVGNSPLHAEIYDLAVRWGSAVICHDARLMGLASGWGLGAAAAQAGAELGRTVAEDEILAWTAQEDLREASFLGALAATARPLIFHSEQSVELVRERFGVEARFLPFAVQRCFASIGVGERKAARLALGLPRGKNISLVLAL